MSTKTLAAYAANLSYDQIPGEVIQKSKDCVLDTFGGCIYGVDLPWSRVLVNYARRFGTGGKCTILGEPQLRVPPAMAALVNGALAHSFELDNVRQPGAGVHAGATLVTAGLAVGQEHNTSGREWLTAFVAGCEVMFRVGRACRETSEQLGFHAPGLTGTLGAAVTAARLMRLSPEQMVSALGIAASLSSGILAFAKTGTGGMVKRLHLGRAAEGGVLAAYLALEGFSGPEGVIEGPFGFLQVFARDPDLSALTDGLGERYEVETICIKQFPCHITAQAPIQALAEIRRAHPFDLDSIEEIEVAGSEKIVTHHNIPEPKDLMMAQYSLPFALAMSLFHPPQDPRHFNDENITDERILEVSRKVKLSVDETSRGVKGYLGTKLRVRLKDGGEFRRDLDEFKGCPGNPLSPKELQQKFSTLTAAMSPQSSKLLAERIACLEELQNLNELMPGGGG